jgi:ribosomal protein L37AE/L43A
VREAAGGWGKIGAWANLAIAQALDGPYCPRCLTPLVEEATGLWRCPGCHE